MSCYGCKRDLIKGAPKKISKFNFTGKSVVLAGYSVRSLNSSAKSLGLKTLAIDCYADMDLRRSADEAIHIIQEKPNELDKQCSKQIVEIIRDEIIKKKELIESYDYFITGSAFENYPSIIKELEQFKNYIGNSSSSVDKVRDPKKLFKFLMESNIKFPKTIIISEKLIYFVLKIFKYIEKQFHPDQSFTKSDQIMKFLKDSSQLLISKINENESTFQIDIFLSNEHKEIQFDILKFINENPIDSKSLNFTNKDQNLESNEIVSAYEHFEKTFLYFKFIDKLLDTIILPVINFPLVVKHRRSGGGNDIDLIENRDEFYFKFQEILKVPRGEIIIQEFIKGLDMSCSFISNGTDFEIISLSKQIIGEKKLGCTKPFAYCGNIMSKLISDPKSPLNSNIIQPLKNIVEKITKYAHLKGSNGIDFIIKLPKYYEEKLNIADNYKYINLDSANPYPPESEIYFIELNPRFQGTMDLFEFITGYNILEMHIDSILNHRLPNNIEYPDFKPLNSNKPDQDINNNIESYTFAKAIIYSPINFHIFVDLQNLGFNDVPLIGEYYKKGMPVCSMIVYAKNEKEVFKKILEERNLFTKVNNLKDRILKEDKDSEFIKD